MPASTGALLWWKAPYYLHPKAWGVPNPTGAHVMVPRAKARGRRGLAADPHRQPWQWTGLHGVPITVLVGEPGAGKTLRALDMTHTGGFGWTSQEWNPYRDVHFMDAHYESALTAGLMDLAQRLSDRRLSDRGDHQVSSRWAAKSSPQDLVLEALAGSSRGWILVLDGLDDPEVLARAWSPAGLLRRGTQFRQPCRIIVTSRVRDRTAWPRWATVVQLDPLPVPEAAALLIEIAGSAAGPGHEAEALASRLGGNPLALRLAGAQLRASHTLRGAGRVLTYRDCQDLLDRGSECRPALRKGAGQQETVAALSELSLDLLADCGVPAGRPLLRLLGGFADAPLPLGILIPTVLAPAFADPAWRTALTGRDQPCGAPARLTDSAVRQAVEGLRAFGLLHTLNELQIITSQDTYVAVNPAVAQAQRDAWDTDLHGEVDYRQRAVELLHTWAAHKQAGTCWPALVPHVEAFARHAPRMDRATADKYSATAARVAAGLRGQGQDLAAVLLSESAAGRICGP